MDKDELRILVTKDQWFINAQSLLAARPFGSDEDHYADDFNWLNHPPIPSHIESDDFRIEVGADQKPYLCLY